MKLKFSLSKEADKDVTFDKIFFFPIFCCTVPYMSKINFTCYKFESIIIITYGLNNSERV